MPIDFNESGLGPLGTARVTEIVMPLLYWKLIVVKIHELSIYNPCCRQNKR